MKVSSDTLSSFNVSMISPSDLSIPSTGWQIFGLVFLTVVSHHSLLKIGIKIERRVQSIVGHVEKTGCCLLRLGRI